MPKKQILSYSLQKFKKINEPIQLKINDIELKQKTSEKYLGLNLDHYLNWNKHIHSIKAKLTSLTGTLRGVTNCLPQKIKYLIYNSLVKPHIDYLIEIWGTANKTNLKTIQVAQNKLIKCLFNYDFKTPTVNIYKNTKIMTIRQTYFYYTCLLFI